MTNLADELVDGEVVMVVLMSLIMGALLDRFKGPADPVGESTSMAVTEFIDIRIS